MSNLHGDINRTIDTGLLYGGSLSINVDTTKFNVLSGSGQIVDNYTDPKNPRLTYVEWSSMTDMSDTYLTSSLDTQIAINSSGSLTQFNRLLTPGYSPVSFQYRYRNGTGGFTTSTTTTTLVPASYDDGDGTLGSVSNAEWTIQRMYLFTIGTVYVTYGQVKYATLSAASDAINVENPIIDPQFSDASLRAYIIMRGNTTDLTDSAAARIVRPPRIN